jgi:hypothetical protein
MTALPGRLTASTLVLLALWPSAAAAQTSGARGMIGLTLQSYGIDADHADGVLPAVGVGAILTVNPLLDFEAEWLRPNGAARRQYTGISFSLAEFGASREEIERQGVLTRTTQEREVTGVLSFGAAFHPRPSASRFEPRFFVGGATHFARDRTLRDPLQWPATVTLERVLQMQPPVEQHRRALGSVTLGAGVAIALGRTLVLLPEVRYDYGSIGDEINNAWRAGTRMLWRF